MKLTTLNFKEVLKELAQYKIELTKKDLIQLQEEEQKFILINKEPAFFYLQNKPLPLLKYLQHPEHQHILKKITIDMGAIKFIINGADVMRPGITAIEEGIQKDEPVVIIDQTHKKPLAVGIALFSGEEMQKMTSGKVIKNVHYVGDELWKKG